MKRGGRPPNNNTGEAPARVMYSLATSRLTSAASEEGAKEIEEVLRVGDAVRVEDGGISEERAEEQKLIRRLQMMMNMVMQVIAQDTTLTVDDASQMIADSRKAALAMFPGKELAYDLIWRPRFQRLMRERFRIM